MKCNICGKDEAIRRTWSDEWVCDDCCHWIGKWMLDNTSKEIIYEQLKYIKK